MSFQNNVDSSLNEGVAGSKASSNPFSSSVKQAKDACAPGLFLWGSADGKTFAPHGTGVPDGFCMLTHTGLITDYLSEAQMIIPLGFNATAVHDGDWYARATTTVSIKQKVFANNTTGAIATGAAGATIAGHTETQFTVSYVAEPGTAGSVIIISRY